jgi:hypothetical protein
MYCRAILKVASLASDPGDEVDMVVTAQEPVHALGQGGCRDVDRRVRVVRQRPYLRGRDVGQLRAAVASVDAPEASHGLQVLRAVGVDDSRTVALSDDQRLCLKLPVWYDGMEHILEILADDSRLIGGWDIGLGRGHVCSPCQHYHLVMNIFLRV